MGGGLESRCVGRVYGADIAVRLIIRTAHTTHPPLQKLSAENHMPQLNV